MLNFQFLEKGLEIVFPPHFVIESSTKMFPMLSRIFTDSYIDRLYKFIYRFISYKFNIETAQFIYYFTY